MKRTLLLAAGAIMVIAAGLFYWLRGRAEQSGTVSTSRVETLSALSPTSPSKSPRGGPTLQESASADSRLMTAADVQDVRSFKSMDEAGKARVDATVIKLSGVNTEFGDLYALAKGEAADPKWSAATESAIDVALRAGGAGYSGLQVGAPHCSATVCIVEAAAIAGTNSQGSPSDWQTLVGSVYAEPWFAENFVDARLVMADDATGTVYISVFERKP